MTGILDYSKIKKMLITEKAVNGNAISKYTFEVNNSCSKGEVSSLVSKMFNVNVLKVNIIKSKPKTRRFRGVVGNTKASKKAIVTIGKDQAINL